MRFPVCENAVSQECVSWGVSLNACWFRLSLNVLVVGAAFCFIFPPLFLLGQKWGEITRTWGQPTTKKRHNFPGFWQGDVWTVSCYKPHRAGPACDEWGQWRFCVPATPWCFLCRTGTEASLPQEPCVALRLLLVVAPRKHSERRQMAWGMGYVTLGITCSRAEWSPSGWIDRLLAMLCSLSRAVNETLSKGSSLLNQNTRALVIQLLEAAVQPKV